MALVVLLRGVNVGGHRTVRPTALADRLKPLDVVTVGSAGTFVVRGPVTQAEVRAEVKRRMPFEADVIVCRGRDITALVARNHFAKKPDRRDIVRFVSVLSRRPRTALPAPISLPSRGTWVLKVLRTDGRFVVGLYRRQMKALRYLGELDRLYGVPLTTRSWSTITAIGEILTRR